jgi:hypothetical protein
MIYILLKFYIPFYILSTIFCYFTNRKWFIKNNENPDLQIVFVVFIPFINLISGFASFIDNLDIEEDSICKKFFNIK